MNSGPKLDKLALIAQMIDSAEKSIQSARQILREVMGAKGAATLHAERAQSLNLTASGKVIEGVFDGQNMIGPDGKKYSVPANYASKSKLVEGDLLKLTIAGDGSFIYKQIGPIDRRQLVGMLVKNESTGDWYAMTDGKRWRLLTAAVTYFHGQPGDEAVIQLPKSSQSIWAAVENIIKVKP